MQPHTKDLFTSVYFIQFTILCFQQKVKTKQKKIKQPGKNKYLN